MTASEIEPTAFRLVDQCIIQLCHLAACRYDTRR